MFRLGNKVFKYLFNISSLKQELKDQIISCFLIVLQKETLTEDKYSNA